MKHRKASSVKATPEVSEFISTLPKSSGLLNLIKKALAALGDNIFSGTQIEKGRIPKFYIEKYGVTNINILRLDASRRLIYTLIADADGISVNILEIFSDHKQYEKRFGYK